jgi:hypothetical protein
MGASMSIHSDGEGTVTCGSEALRLNELLPLDSDCQFGLLFVEIPNLSYAGPMIIVFDDHGPRTALDVSRKGDYCVTRSRVYASGGPDCAFK